MSPTLHGPQSEVRVRSPSPKSESRPPACRRSASRAGRGKASMARGEAWVKGGDLYGGGCPCSSTPCAGTRGRDKARGAKFSLSGSSPPLSLSLSGSVSLPLSGSLSPKASRRPWRASRPLHDGVLRRAAHGMRGGDFTEKRTSGMSRPTPIAAVPPPGQLTSRGQSVGVADGHATTAGAARATRRGREGRRGGDLYGGGCPCSSTPCAGTRGRDKARGAQKVEHMF